MEKNEEIEEILGKQNVKVLRKAIAEARLKIAKIRMIALKMKGTVFATFEQHRKDESPVDVFNYMLETWYDEVLFDPGVDGYQELMNILKDDGVAQRALALKMTPVKQGVLKIGLPESHYKIPIQEGQTKTGSLPYPSNQSGQTCASHAIGKVILEILDSIGWDADQQTVIEAIIAKLQPGGQAENPDSFNNVAIKVGVTNKEDKGKNGDVAIEVGVHNRWGDQLGPHAFRTIPVLLTGDLKKHKIGMVLRWDMWNSSKNKHEPHAIYAKEYDPATEMYSCINSWGNQEGFPQIHKSGVESIYYVTITQV